MILRNIGLSRDIDEINPKEPRKIFPFGGFLPLMMGVGGVALANGIAPTVPIQQNPIAILNLLLIVVSLLLVPIVKIGFEIWGWQTRVLGVSGFYIGSVASLSWNSIFCIVLYGHVPQWILMLFIGVNLFLTLFWLKRYISYYENIRKLHQDYWKALYVEENDAVYFSQPCDKWLTQKKITLNHFYGPWATVLPMAGAICLLPFMTEITRWAGVPFVHIFLALGAAPLSIMLLGVSMKGFLLHYYYPWKIKRATGKSVYVDLVTPCNTQKAKRGQIY